MVQRLVDGDHLAQLHQLLDDLRCLDRHLVGQFGHRDGLGHVHFQNAEFWRWCGAMVFAVAVTAAFATRAGAPIGRAACARAGIAAGFEFFLFGRITGPAAGQLGRLDLFARTGRIACARRFGGFCDGGARCRLVQSAFDGAFGVHRWLGFFLFGCDRDLVGRGHHHPDGGSFGLGFAAAIAQIGSALAFLQGRFLGHFFRLGSRFFTGGLCGQLRVNHRLRGSSGISGLFF